MSKLYDSGIASTQRKGTFKLSVDNANVSTGNAATLENPVGEVILIDRVVAEIKTAAEEASALLHVGVGDNANDNVLNSHVELLNVNAQNVGAVVGPAAGVNANCRVAAKGASANAFILVGADNCENADNLVADIYVDYIIP